MKNFLALVLLAGLGYATAALALADPLGLVQSFAQTVSTTAARVAPATWTRQGMKSCLIGNASATPVYLGGSDLTAANGFPICTDTAACTRSEINPDVIGGEVYAIVSSGTQAIRVLCGG